VFGYVQLVWGWVYRRGVPKCVMAVGLGCNPGEARKVGIYRSDEVPRCGNLRVAVLPSSGAQLAFEVGPRMALCSPLEQVHHCMGATNWQG
jgi:hypothetical protein